MVALMEADRVGELAGMTAMGNEGAQWIGMAPFVSTPHLVQNLGDGTFFHSGSLAIRFAVASGVNITYKLLYNGTVAMTGGQAAVGAVGVPEVARMLLLEGVEQVLITTDDRKKYRRMSLPDGVEVWDRRRIIEAQERLAKVPGVTVLIHDQDCAAEKRRARKRGKVAEPATRVVINERVCEGCGDCGAKSNCLSVQPVDTPFGRKTTIDQSSCNLDDSCLEGDCPSFMTVEVKGDARPLVRQPPRAFGEDGDDLEAPSPLVDTERWAVRMSGIGGTGVVTVSQVLGTAAMLDGLLVRGLDQTGLSQKAGPVVSDLRFSRDEPQPSNKATEGMVDLYLAFDLLVGASESHLVGASPDRTVVIGSVSPTPTGAMVVHPEIGQPSAAALRRRLDGVSRADVNRYVDAAAIVEAMFGDVTVTNLFLVGVAVQAGGLALRPESIERAVELNGVAVDRNIEAFRWGRRWVVDPEAVRAAAGLDPKGTAAERDPVEVRTSDLAAYQSKRLAGSYRAVVDRVRAREGEVAPGSIALTDAVVRNLHKLMAYKDEYEVARLLLAPEARAAAEAVAGPGAKVTWQLHPPVLRAMGMKRKVALGRWATPAFGVLRGMRRLRGHWFDPFGHTEVRKLERALVPEYLGAVDRLLAGLRADNVVEAAAIAELPDQVRGYEHLKLERAAVYRAELDRRLARFETS
jgi:indolepyruvate ferredoxin oxidoreductase